MRKRTHKSFGYWQAWANVEMELREIIATLHHFPTCGELLDRGRSDLAHAISDMHDGFHAVRKRMGYVDGTQKAHGYWSKWSNIVCELTTVMSDIGHFPTSEELSACNKSSLSAAVSKHGGFPTVRVRMGYERGSRRPDGYWRIWENVERELKKVINKIGHFPSPRELARLKKTILSFAIRRYGGFPTVRVRMGYERGSRRPDGYWKEWKNLERELIEIYKDFGHFPTYGQLVTLKRYDVINASRHYGGLPAVRARMGYGSPVVRTVAAFQELIRTEDDARTVVEHFAGNDVDIADILAVVFADRLDRQRALNLLREPGLAAWLGQFQKPNGAILDLLEVSAGLLPHDQDGIITGIIHRRMLEWRRSFLGPRPSVERKREFMKELEKVKMVLEENTETESGKEQSGHGKKEQQCQIKRTAVGRRVPRVREVLPNVWKVAGIDVTVTFNNGRHH